MRLTPLNAGCIKFRTLPFLAAVEAAKAGRLGTWERPSIDGTDRRFGAIP
jgi:hypothetical protein